nr:transcription factor bHLH36-like isoform X2 [Ipomoea batatas]GME11844.1 transcription factor bHLH36-like isoform X2 [Ipomoea batatas]
MQPNCSSLPPPRPRRHLAEKHRRQQMKGLYRQLASLVPHEKSLENNVNELKARKDSLQLPVAIAVNESEGGESLEINIVCGSEKKEVMKMDKVFRIFKRKAGASSIFLIFPVQGLHTTTFWPIPRKHKSPLWAPRIEKRDKWTPSSSVAENVASLSSSSFLWRSRWVLTKSDDEIIASHAFETH